MSQTEYPDTFASGTPAGDLLDAARVLLIGIADDDQDNVDIGLERLTAAVARAEGLDDQALERAA